MEREKSQLGIQIDEAISHIRNITNSEPTIGIILGTGLGGFAKEIEIENIIPYEEIPHFPLSTVEFHSGKLIFGKVGEKYVVAMQGRFHYYEGYSFQQIVFPVRVMKFLGVKTLLISNACGALNTNFKKSEIMIIEDYINLLGGNPLIGANDESVGPRFPDMSEPYSKKLINLAEKIAENHKIKVNKGVYVSLPGPMLETRAEYRYLRMIGADAVGMSTVPETIAARHCGMDVLGFSVITDECDPDNLEQVDIFQILAAAEVAEPNLNILMKNIINNINIIEQ